MPKLLDGKKVAAAILEECRQTVLTLKEKGVSPALEIVRVGERPEDISYEKGAIKRCESVGVAAHVTALPPGAPQEALLSEISRLNAENPVHGILLMRPLPPHMDGDAARNAIAAEKDIDGVADASLAGVFTGAAKGFAPCTAQACLEILDYYQIPLRGKRVAVVGRSLVVGRPVAMLLMSKDATVTICHTKTENLAGICRSSDIVVVAAGKARFLGEGCFSAGQAIIDAGINVDGQGKLCGDVDFSLASQMDLAITPVPGGVGSVTSAILAANAATAARRVAGLA